MVPSPCALAARAARTSVALAPSRLLVKLVRLLPADQAAPLWHADADLRIAVLTRQAQTA